MPRWGRTRTNRYQKTRSFSRAGSRSYGGRGRGYSQTNRSYQRAEADINIVIGRRRIWIFNNTEDPVVVMPGQYIVLEITREGDNQLGHFFRTALIGDGKAAAQTKAPEAPEERPQDWV